jgi:hypothetical protein
MSGRLVILSVLWILPPALSEFLPSSPGEDLSWLDGLEFAVGVVVIFLFVRLAMAPALLADVRRGPLWAFASSWVLTRRRFWPLLGFGLLHFLVLILLHVVTGGRRLAVLAIFHLGAYPVSCLAYVSLYLSYARQPSLAADGLTPAAEG